MRGVGGRRILGFVLVVVVVLVVADGWSSAAVATPRSAPVVVSVDPARGQGATDRKVLVRGYPFASGAQLSFPGSGVTVESTVFVSRFKLVAKITVAQDAPPGIRGATVTNPDGAAGTCEACFTVDPGPKPSSVSPSSASRGETLTVTVTGSGFQNPAKVEFGRGVEVDAVAVLSDAQLEVTIAIAGTAWVGARDVEVTNKPDAGVGTCFACFAVTA
jgi:hypothetical protein